MKLNGSIYFDKNNFMYRGQTESYLPNDTFRFSENQTVINRPQLYSARLHFTANKSNYFLNNSFEMAAGQEDFKGRMDFNNSLFNQNLHKKLQQFSNDFSWIPAVKLKGIAEFRWHSGYNKTEQQLNLDSGYYFAIVPQQGYHSQLVQRLQTPLWYHQIYAGYRLPKKILTSQYKVGFVSSSQQVTSNLTIIDGNTITPYANDQGNNLMLHNNSTFAEARYQVKYKQFRADAKLPINLRKLSLSQPGYNMKEQKSRLFFLPEAWLTYNFNNERYIRADYKFQNSFTNITQTYSGAILQNFQNLQYYSQGLQQIRTHHSSIAYSHQRSIKLFYVNVTLSYDHTVADAVRSDSFASNIRQTFLILLPNNRDALTLNGGISQYLFSLKTKVGLKLQKQVSFNDQYLNGAFSKVQVNNFLVNTSINKKLARVLNIDNITSLSWQSVRVTDGDRQTDFAGSNSFNFDENLKLTFNLFKKYFVETSALLRTTRISSLNKYSYFFLDATVKRLKLINGMDVELHCTNLLNVKNYYILLQGGNQVFSSQYFLRGRTIMARCSFSF